MTGLGGGVGLEGEGYWALGGSEAFVHSRVVGGEWRLKAECVVGQICVWLLGPVGGMYPWRWCEVCLCGMGGVV